LGSLVGIFGWDLWLGSDDQESVQLPWLGDLKGLGLEKEEKDKF
jgi:hypothetical protein